MKKLIFALFLIVCFVFSFGMAQARTRDFNNAAGWALVDADNTVSLQDANDVVSLEEQNIINVGEIHLDSIHSDANTTITTPDVSFGKIFKTSANGHATAITDLDNPKIGETYIIIGGSATNSSTIGDSGNFALSAGWTAALDDVLILYVQADNDYIEIGRVNN